MTVVVIGIDPHKNSHTATAINAARGDLGTIRVQATRSTTKQLLVWAGQWPDRTWAIEGAAGLGRLLAQQLVACGELVVKTGKERRRPARVEFFQQFITFP